VYLRDHAAAVQERPADARLLADLAELNIQNYATTGGSIATVSDGESVTVSYLE